MQTGLVLGRTRLIERRDEGFIVRERSEIERLLRRAYESGSPVERIMPSLATVARALNANDQCLARIAAVHLRLPDLQTQAARDAMEAEDRLIKYARDEGGSAEWDPAEHPRTGTSPNPGWFAPKPGDASPIHTAENHSPTRHSDSSQHASDEWVRLRPGPKRIDELADFIEWIANARPEDEQAIRAEIKRCFADAGDGGSAAALNAHLTALLKLSITREQRQRILDLMDVFTRADPAEYARNRDWATGAAIAAGACRPSQEVRRPRREARQRLRAPALRSIPPMRRQRLPQKYGKKVRSYADEKYTRNSATARFRRFFAQSITFQTASQPASNPSI